MSSWTCYLELFISTFRQQSALDIQCLICIVRKCESSRRLKWFYIFTTSQPLHWNYRLKFLLVPRLVTCCKIFWRLSVIDHNPRDVQSSVKHVCLLLIIKKISLLKSIIYFIKLLINQVVSGLIWSSPIKWHTDIQT